MAAFAFATPLWPAFVRIGLVVCVAIATASLVGAVILWWSNSARSLTKVPVASAFLRFHQPLLVRLSACLKQMVGLRRSAQLEAWLLRLARRAGKAETLPPALLEGCLLLGALYGAGLGMAVRLALSGLGWSVVALTAVLGASLPLLRLRDLAIDREQAVFRSLPFFLEVLTLALEAGANLGAALAIAVDRLPPGDLREELARVLQDLRAGRSRAEAFAALAERVKLPGVVSLVAALQIAERQGASLGAVLRAQAQQARSMRWLRAERQAMQAPVRMMLPLTVCIFPGTFAVLLFPIASRLLQEGWAQ